jgi:hypothetical protein
MEEIKQEAQRGPVDRYHFKTLKLFAAITIQEHRSFCRSAWRLA